MRNRQKWPIGGRNFFWKKSKSWQLDKNTWQRGQRSKKEVKSLKPHTYFYIVFIFIFRIPLIPSWIFSKKLGRWKLKEGFLIWEATGNSSKEKLSALWKGYFFSFLNPHFHFIQTFPNSKILGRTSISTNQSGCPNSYKKWKVSSYSNRNSVIFSWKLILCHLFSSSIFPPVSTVHINSDLEWKKSFLKFTAEGITKRYMNEFLILIPLISWFFIFSRLDRCISLTAYFYFWFLFLSRIGWWLV